MPRALAGERCGEIAKWGELDLAASFDGVRVRINLSASRTYFRRPPPPQPKYPS
jgi:hypothetical protein